MSMCVCVSLCGIWGLLTATPLPASLPPSTLTAACQLPCNYFSTQCAKVFFSFDKLNIARAMRKAFFAANWQTFID